MSAKHDVYSLLILLFFILTNGEHPFHFDGDENLSNEDRKDIISRVELKCTNIEDEVLHNLLEDLLKQHVSALRNKDKGNEVTLENINMVLLTYSLEKKLEVSNMSTSTVCKRFGVLLAFSGLTAQKRIQCIIDKTVEMSHAPTGTNENDQLVEIAYEKTEERRKIEKEKGLSSARADVTVISKRLKNCGFDASYLKDDALFGDFSEMIDEIKTNIGTYEGNVCVFLHISGHGYYNTTLNDTVIDFGDDKSYALENMIHVIREKIENKRLKLIITVDACRVYISGKESVEYVNES